MVQKQIYVITGGPGFGKTALIDELRKSGYNCSGEFARNIIETQLAINGDVLPWKNTKLFQHEVLQQRISFYESVPDKAIAFADRGIPDQLAFAQYKGFQTPAILTESAASYRYALQVFVTPPWLEIFENDAIRIETFEEALLIHNSILKTYADLKYQIIELPLLPVKQRIDYLFQTIPNYKNNEH